jgi:hypothetical protein
MPISAIETGCVGKVLRPFEIAAELTRLSHPAAVVPAVAPRALVAEIKAGSPPRHVAAARSSINS